MTKTGARLGVGAILLTLVLAGCADGGGDDDAKGAAAISQSLLQESSSDLDADEEQADCVGKGFVDEIGVARLKEYGILTQDLEMAGGSFVVNQMDERDAASAAAVFVDCVDAETMFFEQMAADSDMTQEQQQCAREVIDADALKRTFSLIFQGRGDEAQADLMAPVYECLGTDTAPTN